MVFRRIRDRLPGTTLLKTSMPKGDVSYTAGKHAMKFGVSYNRYTKNQKLFLNAEGNNTFSGATGDPFMDMVLGLATGGYSESQAAPIRHYVNQTPSAYAMDTWKVTSSSESATWT